MLDKSLNDLLDAVTICINCGLPGGAVDLAGCTRDTETAHHFRPVKDRPFAYWTYEEIFARMNRANIKAASAAATAAHFVRCPSEPKGSYAHRLYVQKAQKRLTLARYLALELWIRAGGPDLVGYDSPDLGDLLHEAGQWAETVASQAELSRYDGIDERDGGRLDR